MRLTFPKFFADSFNCRRHYIWVVIAKLQFSLYNIYAHKNQLNI